MSTRRFPCPECGQPISVSDMVSPGQSVRCPSCSCTVRVPEGGEFRPAGESAEAPAPRERWDEGIRPAGAGYGDREGLGLAGLSNEYSINFGEWFRYGTAHWGAVLGPMIGYFFVLLLICIGLIITCIGIPVLIIIIPALSAGFYVVGLAELKGEPWSFNDFFGGFRQFGSLVGNYWLVFLITGLWQVPGIVLFQVGQAKYQAEQQAEIRAIMEEHHEDENPFEQFSRIREAQRTHWEDPLVLTGQILQWIGQLVGLFFTIRLLFCIPLILDRKCGAVEAIQGSWLLTRGHFWGLLGVAIVLGLINLAGLLLCLIGALFTFPLITMVLLAGYLLIAGTRRPIEAPASGPAY